MTLNQLNLLYINEGTESNPFILTDREVDTLYRISVQADPEKHKIEGWVNTETGTIPSYVKYSLEKKFPNLHILATGTSDQSWTVDFVTHSINEGEQTRMLVTNLTSDSLEYEVTVESLQVNKGIYTESQVLQHFHVDTDKGVVYYDSPSSDAGWVASLAVKFKPSYVEVPTADDYRTVRINVVAVAVTGIEVVADDYVGLNGSTTVRVRALPVNNTKESEEHKVELSVVGGGYVAPNILSGLNGETIYYAPQNGNIVTITADLHMFGASAVYSAASKKISLRATIKAVIQEKDGNNPVELKSAYITVTDPDGVVTNLKNGETMLVVADGFTTYTIDCIETDNYSGVVDKKTVTPKDALTIVTATYAEKVYGFTFIFDDDSIEMADDYYDDKGNIPSDAQSRIRDHLVALGVRNSDCAYMIPFGWIEFDSHYPFSENGYYKDYKYSVTPDASLYVFDGYLYTQRLLEYLESKSFNTGVLGAAKEKNIIVGGVEREGYIPSIGELAVLNKDSVTKYLNNVLILKGKNPIIVTDDQHNIVSCLVNKNASNSNFSYNYRTSSVGSFNRALKCYIIEVCKY